jgi:hypothetical protein
MYGAGTPPIEPAMELVMNNFGGGREGLVTRVEKRSG